MMRMLIVSIANSIFENLFIVFNISYGAGETIGFLPMERRNLKGKRLKLYYACLEWQQAV